MRLSIIIPTFNKIARLCLALESYKEQMLSRDNFEIVIIADESDRDQMDLIAHYNNLLNITVVITSERGMPLVRNMGAKHAKGDYLGFFDDDVLVSPMYLSNCLEAINNNYKRVVRGPVYTLYACKFFKDPQNGIPFPEYEQQLKGKSEIFKTLLSKEMIEKDWPTIEKMCTKLNRFERIVKICLEDKSVDKKFKWMGFSGSGVILHKECFFMAGGYDEELGKWWGAESIDLGYRLAQIGVEFMDLPYIYTAHMDHPRGESLKKFGDSFNYVYNKYNDDNIKFIAELISNKTDVVMALKEMGVITDISDSLSR